MAGARRVVRRSTLSGLGAACGHADEPRKTGVRPADPFGRPREDPRDWLPDVASERFGQAPDAPDATAPDAATDAATALMQTSSLGDIHTSTQPLVQGGQGSRAAASEPASQPARHQGDRQEPGLRYRPVLRLPMSDAHTPRLQMQMQIQCKVMMQ